MTLDDLRLGATIADVLRENVYARPNAEAVTDGTRRLSWKQLNEAALASCSHFAGLGIQRGDRVAVVLSNQIEAVILYWACALSGAIFVGASPRLGHDELENVLRHSSARVVFVGDDSLRRRLSDMALTDLCEVVIVEISDPIGMFSQRMRANVKPAAPSRNDTFAISYTSGTTGPPKGVVLSHGNLVWNAAAVSERLRCAPEDTFLLTVGITHIFGISPGILAAAISGARLVLLNTFAAGAALDLCEWERVTVLLGTPTMFVLELAAQRRAPRDLSSLRTGIVAAAPVQAELVDAIRSELQCDVQIAWGLTETSPAVTMTAFDDPPQARRTSVGRPLPHALVLVENGSHEFGEILVKSPGVFRGYFNDPELTATAFRSDEWLRTGDLGIIDDEGFLYLKGRRKDIIIRGGLHVYPDEVERILESFAWVAAVAVVGIPDAVLGERSCACIVVNESAGPPDDLLAAVRAAISSRLADYKAPDAVLRVAELPRNSNGKLLKRVLREDAIARIAAH